MRERLIKDMERQMKEAAEFVVTYDAKYGKGAWKSDDRELRGLEALQKQEEGYLGGQDQAHFEELTVKLWPNRVLEGSSASGKTGAQVKEAAVARVAEQQAAATRILEQKREQLLERDRDRGDLEL